MSIVESIYSMGTERKQISSSLRKRGTISMSESIRNTNRSGKMGMIVEFKRASPSGFIMERDQDPEEYFRSVISDRVSGLSVLTEPEYFKGSYNDIAGVQHLGLPILDKDFISSREMVMNAYNSGSDAILLISDFLSEYDVNDLSALSRRMGMEVLLEFHDPSALKFPEDLSGIMLGYNRRNLKTLRIEEDTKGIELLTSYDGIRIIESGIDSSNYARINNLDCNAMLIGRAVLEGDILPGDA